MELAKSPVIADYFRIVRPTENLQAVHLEAINSGCHVWTNGHSKTVISKKCPVGMRKLCAGYRFPTDHSPEAA